MCYPVHHQWYILSPKNPCACGLSCGPACRSLEDNSLMLLFPRTRRCLMICFSPHSGECVTRAVPLWYIGLASVPNEVPWKIYSKDCRWWVSGTEVNFQSPIRCFKLWCCISNYVALEYVFKLFCYRKETFQHFHPAFFCVCVWFGFCLFCFCNLPIKWALFLQKFVVILFYLWTFLDAFWVSLSTHDLY